MSGNLRGHPRDDWEGGGVEIEVKGNSGGVKSTPLPLNKWSSGRREFSLLQLFSVPFVTGRTGYSVIVFHLK